MKEHGCEGLVDVEVVEPHQYGVQVHFIDAGEGEEVDVVVRNPDKLGYDQADRHYD